MTRPRIRGRGVLTSAVLTLLTLSACGSEARFSSAELEEMTQCGGGTVFPGRQADRHASYSRACVSAYGSLRISEFRTNAERDAYVAGDVVNPVTGPKPELDFFVYGDRWAIACDSRPTQAEVADVTGGEQVP